MSPVSVHTISLSIAGWMAILTIAGALVFDFDCRRNGVDCGQGNECDVSKGTCVCLQPQNTTLNYMCQDSQYFPCEENSYGTGCQLDRVQVDCSRDAMFVNVNPQGNFSGAIFVLGNEGVADCQFQVTGVPPDYVKDRSSLKGWSLELKNDDVTCGRPVRTEDSSSGPKKITNTRDYFIQYSKNFRSNLDQKVTVKCVLTEGVTKVTSQVDDVKEGNGGFQDLDVDSNVDLDVITFSILKKDDQPLDADVTLGDEIKLVFTLTPDRGYVDFSLLQCLANNTVEDPVSGNFRSVIIVENDCPSTEAQALFQNGVIKDTSTITVSISAFMFSGGTSKVGFTCDVTLCREENRNECKKRQCAGITSQADQVVDDESDRSNVTPSANDTDTGNNQTTQGAGNGNTPQVNDTVTGGDTPQANDSVADIDDASPTGNTTTAQTNDTVDPGPQENATTAGTEIGDGGDGVSVPTEADGEEVGGDVQRRRRAAGDDVIPTKKVYSDMTVRDPAADIQEPAILNVDKDCLEEPEVITVIAILSVIVLTLSLVTLVVVCHVIRSGRSKACLEEDSVCSKDSELRTTVDPVPHAFNIPRLEIRTKRPVSYTNT